MKKYTYYSRFRILWPNCKCPLSTSLWFSEKSFKNHVPSFYRLEDEAGATSDPCCIRDATVNQKLFAKLNMFSISSGSSMHGYGLSHSYGLNRANTKNARETTVKPKTYQFRFVSTVISRICSHYKVVSKYFFNITYRYIIYLVSLQTRIIAHKS